MTRGPSAQRVVSTSRLPPAVEKLLNEKYQLDHAILKELGRDQFVTLLSSASALIVRPGDRIDAELINDLPKTIKLLASYSVGLDHVDEVAAQSRNIAVSNTPGVLTDATADVAMLLILGTMRGAGDAHRLLHSRTWTGWAPEQVFGVEVTNKTLGIVGAGRIGVATANRARAFGLNVRYWSRRQSDAIARMGGHRDDTLTRLVEQSDVVSLHVPSTEKTHHLIDASLLKRFKPGSFLINTGRGDLVDDDAVLEALGSGRLKGVGLDVFENEPNIDPRYYSVPGTFLLPHIGSATDETRLKMGQLVLAALDNYI